LNLDEPEADIDGADTEATLLAASSGIGAESETATISEPGGVALSDADLKELSKRNHLDGIEEEHINGQRFVKLKDLLPPCPPRGVFDVTRIRDSAYFFS
jgi:DNA-directed RNA polymerase